MAEISIITTKRSFRLYKKDSLQSAENVRNAIFSATDNLKYNPEIHPLDKYRKNNDGTFRAFEIYSYRIAYQLTKSEIRILRVRHTKQEPLGC